VKELVIIALLATLPATARAQELNFGALDDGTSVTAVTTGAEHGLVIGAGYGYVAALGGHRLVLGADLTIDAADARDVALRTGVLAPVLGDGPWKLIVAAGAVARSGHNDVAQLIDIGADASLLAGRYSRRWFAAGEVGFDAALVTHIANSDSYRMVVYPGARDGWYGTTGGLFRFGVQGGVSFGSNDLTLRAGVLRDIVASPPLFPFYATVGYDRRW